jgi:transposase
LAEYAHQALWGERNDMLASFPALVQGRRVGQTPLRFAEPPGPAWADQLGSYDHRLGQRQGRFWGAHTGPNPTDRAKNGCKRHIISEANGLPLVVKTTPANVRDDTVALEMLRSIPPIQGPKGRPRHKPKAFQGDRAYGFVWIIAAVLAMQIASLLAPRGSTHGSGLGKTRYVIERTMAWAGNYRRIKFCYERKGAHFQAFNQLAACLICSHRLESMLEG